MTSCLDGQALQSAWNEGQERSRTFKQDADVLYTEGPDFLGLKECE